MRITDNDIRDINAHLEKGKPLPDRYRFLLFGDRKVELTWEGKTGEVTNTVLPFQTIEVIDEPRTLKNEVPQEELFKLDATGRQSNGWTNKLIWGDSNLVLSSLKNGPLRRQIEDEGGVKLIYIDPPFDVGADFSVEIEVGDEKLTKQPTALEEIAYRDTWGRGTDSFLAMAYERIKLLHDILSRNGTMYVHCDWRANSHLRLALDEIFGSESLVNEIAWCTTGATNVTLNYPRKHQTLLMYSKGNPHTFNKDDVRIPYSDGSIDRATRNVVASGGMKFEKIKLNEGGKVPEDYWLDIQRATRYPGEFIGYPTQKPIKLLERVIKASSNAGDIVLDCFVGSGTTSVVAEMLGRRWIGCDIGKFAIHTTRKRMLETQRNLKASGKPYRAFEVLNLGRYERQYYLGIDGDLDPKQQDTQIGRRAAEFNSLIAHAYGAELVDGFKVFNAKRGARMVLIGSIDSPVSKTLVNDTIDEALENGFGQIDILGFDFEMGLEDNMRNLAKSKGIDLVLKYIPRSVFDKQAVSKGQVVFHNLGYVEAKPIINGRTLAIELTDFSVYYSYDDMDDLSKQMTSKQNIKIAVAAGQIIKITKDPETNTESRTPLTKHWSDWIDYWSIDFDFESRKEIIQRPKDIRLISNPLEEEYDSKWTGDYVFENEWQSFRTKKDRNLELKSAPHEYTKSGSYKVAVKVIDIFGNDTTKVIKITIGDE